MKFRSWFVLFLVLPLILSSCAWGQSKAQLAMTPCIADVMGDEVGSLSVEELLAELNKTSEEDWPLTCRRWATLIRINHLKSQLQQQEALLEAIDVAIENQNQAKANAEKTATAEAQPSPTFTPTFIPPTETQTVTPAP